MHLVFICQSETMHFLTLSGTTVHFLVSMFQLLHYNELCNQYNKKLNNDIHVHVFINITEYVR